MSDPGYGSYIANAAEAERNRRSQGQQLMKRLDMQKYGIDTSATTQRYGIDTNKQIAENQLELQNRKFDEQTRQYNQEYGMRKTLFDIAQDERDVSKKIAGNIVSNAAETERSNVQREALLKDDSDTWFSNFRAGDVEADQYSGVGGRIKKWWRDEGFFGEGDSAYDPKYNLTVGGERIDPQLQQLDLTGDDVTVEMLGKYLPAIEAADASGGGKSNKSLMNLWGLLK